MEMPYPLLKLIILHTVSGDISRDIREYYAHYSDKLISPQHITFVTKATRSEKVCSRAFSIQAVHSSVK